MYFRHSEGWTQRNEALMGAVVKKVRTTTRSWLVACDANMCPEMTSGRAFGYKALDTRSLRRQEKAFQPADPKAQLASLSRERTTMSSPVTAFKGRSVVEDFDSRPHRAVTFLVE